MTAAAVIAANRDKMHLIASISQNPGLIKGPVTSGKFSKVYAVIDNDATKNFSFEDERLILLSIDNSMHVKALSEALKSVLAQKLKEDRIFDLDMAVYISAGKGPENSALLSAVMKLGYGIRLVDFDNGMIEL